MNLSKNSWHYRFLDRYDAKIVGEKYDFNRHRCVPVPINLCPYVRAVVWRLIAAWLILPPVAAFAIFVAISPITYLLFWLITGMWNTGGLVTASVIVACGGYAIAACVGGGIWIAVTFQKLGPIQIVTPKISNTLAYQAVKSWHDKVCPILDVEE